LLNQKSRFRFYIPSGDNDREAQKLGTIFPKEVMKFNQSPPDNIRSKGKSKFQSQGNYAYDGLNDAELFKAKAR
jgi:hypothetical protein